MWQRSTVCPNIRGSASTSLAEATHAEALLKNGLILPVLDGLDEIPEQVRAKAISRINDALRPGEHVVVTCRAEDYRNAVRPKRGVEVTLRAAVAVQLHPLNADVVRSYLVDDAAGPETKVRWAPVLDVLGTETPAGQALSAPLMISLARTIYNPRPGELTGALRKPKELCHPDLSDRAAVESLLFDAFIPAAYRHDFTGPWNVQDAERWLEFLARHLERTITSPDLAWWQLRLAVPGFPRAVRSAVMVGVGIVVGILFGVLAGSLAGTVAGTVAGAWAVARIGAGVEYAADLGVRLRVEDVLRMSPKPDLSSAANPQAVLAGDRRTGTARGVLAGAWIGALAGVLFGTAAGAGAAAIYGAAAGVLAGVISSFTFAAWPSYAIARLWLAHHHRLPWPLMDFLADAHELSTFRFSGCGMTVQDRPCWSIGPAQHPVVAGDARRHTNMNETRNETDRSPGHCSRSQIQRAEQNPGRATSLRMPQAPAVGRPDAADSWAARGEPGPYRSLWSAITGAAASAPPHPPSAEEKAAEEDHDADEQQP